MDTRLITCAMTIALALPTIAQTCSTQGDRLLINDVLPANLPPNPVAVSIIRGLCEGEAAFSVFDGVSAHVELNQVACLFAAPGGVNGFIAAVDVEVYDGVTENAGGLGRYQLGPLLWSLSNSTGASQQLMSHGLNVIDLVPFGQGGRGPSLTVTSGKLVVAIRMQINLNGTCSTGYSTNLATDYPGFGPACPAPGVNGIISLGNGAFDPATYPFSLGLTLCNPLFNAYGGNWVIRACISEAQPAAQTSWQGFAQPGGIVVIQQLSPGTPNDSFITLIGGSITHGTPTPWGTWPIDFDFWAECFFGPCRSLLTNHLGQLDSSGQALTTLHIPADPTLAGSGITWYASFLAHDPADFFTWTAIGAPSSAIVIN